MADRLELGIRLALIPSLPRRTFAGVYRPVGTYTSALTTVKAIPRLPMVCVDSLRAVLKG